MWTYELLCDVDLIVFVMTYGIVFVDALFMICGC
jgi:hypothetical protein